MRIRRVVAAVCCSICTAMLPAASGAAVILETATISGEQDRTIGFGIYEDQWYGARFALAQSARITEVGTYVAGINDQRRLFAAVIELGPNGLPSFAPYDIESFALAAVTFATAGAEPCPFACTQGPSTDIRVSFSLTLGPGSYALVIGTGKFGADEAGTFWLGGLTATPGASLFSAHDRSTEGVPFVWEDGTLGAGDQFRFVVLGEPVPEPSTVLLVGIGLAALLGTAVAKHRRQQGGRHNPQADS